MASAGDNTEAADIDERLMALEVKASFTEDLLDELNRTVARQQQQIEALARELVRLRGQVQEMGEQDASGDGTGSRQEVPPHY
ncbi:MAG: SlyX family protein [Pseudomonadota bacterium]|jgi:SlyX protein